MTEQAPVELTPEETERRRNAVIARAKRTMIPCAPAVMHVSDINGSYAVKRCNICEAGPCTGPVWNYVEDDEK